MPTDFIKLKNGRNNIIKKMEEINNTKSNMSYNNRHKDRFLHLIETNVGSIMRIFIISNKI